jgi:ribonuclease Z
VFDAGPGVVRRIFEARELPGLGITRMGPVFITHLHSDHTLGLPDLLYYHMSPASLRVIGPPGTEAMMRHIMEAWAEDRQIRSHESGDSTRMLATTTEVTSGVVYTDSNITVKAFEVLHGEWKHALGYRIEAPDRVIVLSGDTQPTNAVVEACNGCDVLMHEVYGESGAAGGRAGYLRVHTSASELGAIASL